ncbi:protein OS-9 homolog isoform X1 [Selaginella moellendorffii]|uniref:protein OS-9 homolog isoform X1 n=1 Tax=Selaginella moellendorffii TaxID=88036 RepID=UPI000D1D0290|nr:protein OS-9 homolog isoform X1 [Selaginella moellendorffii]|eukprot:XP_024537037.1 protein OS-9 homolog isoform X1 [Selaginella moellendorffii]
MAASRWATWAWTAALLLAGAFADSNRLLPVNSGAVPSFQDPKYKLQFHELQDPYSPEDPDTEMVRMTDRDGRKFECFLPKKPEASPLDGANETEATLAEISRRTPEELLDVLKDRCFHRHEGWWTYELCYHGKFRQVHFETSKKDKKSQEAQEFVLGVYDAEATARLHSSTPVLIQKDPRSQTAALKYFAHMYVNGTKCDLTGAPRETEVRFVCADSGMLLISSIKESPTCKYTVIFQAPMLCKHPLFQEERQPWLVVNCNSVSNDEYEINREQQRPAASEEVSSGNIEMLPPSTTSSMDES